MIVAVIAAKLALNNAMMATQTTVTAVIRVARRKVIADVVWVQLAIPTQVVLAS